MLASVSRIPRAVAALLLLALVASLVVWLAFSRASVEPAKPLAGLAPASASSMAEYGSDPRRRFDAAMGGVESSIAELPRALRLMGTSPASDVRPATARLGTDPANPQTFEVGSTLSNGAVIEEIHADRVVVALRGARTTLFTNGPAGSDAAVMIGGREFAEQIDTVPSSGEQLSQFLRPQLVFDGRRVAGFKIFPGLRPGSLELLGLEAGDVVRSIEGKPVNDDAAWSPIDLALTSGRTISVAVERKGGTITLALDGARMAEAAKVGARLDAPGMGS